MFICHSTGKYSIKCYRFKNFRAPYLFFILAYGRVWLCIIFQALMFKL